MNLPYWETQQMRADFEENRSDYAMDIEDFIHLVIHGAPTCNKCYEEKSDVIKVEAIDVKAGESCRGKVAVGLEQVTL